MGNLSSNAWKGLGSASSPCTIYAPDGFNFGVDTSGRYFKWKEGYFTLGTDMLLGDVNQDGTVNIADAMCIFSWLMENKPAVFVESAADYNQDGSITVSDGVSIIASILDNHQSYLSCPDNNHPHMIDLGLPSGTKWACCNVGATTPEGYGGYYAWGETEEKTTYNWSTYIHCNGTQETCHDLGSDIAGTQYDVAHVKWGGSWVMPSLDQVKELLENCASEWTTKNGVYGRQFTGKNGGSVIFPATGCLWNEELDNVGSVGFYWSSTKDDEYCAYRLVVFSDGSEWYDYFWDNERCNGHAVRPVSK